MDRNTIVSKMMGNFCDSSSPMIDSSGSMLLNTSTINMRLNFDDSITSQNNSRLMISDSSRHSSLFQDRLAERRHSLELLSAKNAISKLEKKVEVLETTRKRARIEYDRDVELQQSEEKTKQNKLENLEQMVSQLVEKLNHCQELTASARKSEDNVKSNLEKQLLDVKREKIVSDEKYKEEISTLKHKVSELQASVTKNEHDIEMRNTEIKSLQDQLRIQRKAVQDSLRHVRELEEKNEELSHVEAEVKELNEKLLQQDESIKLAKHSHLQESTLSDLEKENRQLKSENKLLRDERDNVALLEEQIDSLRKELERAGQRCTDTIRLESENDLLSKRLKQWELLAASDSKTSPQDLARQIGELQSREATMTLTCGELNTEINSLTNERNALQVTLSTLQQSVREKDKKIQQNSELIKRLQKKLLLLTKERDSYHRGLEFHEKELNPSSPSAYNSRIQSLENLVKGYQTHIEKLEEELKNAGQVQLDSIKEEPEHSKIIEQLQEKLSQVEKQNGKLQDQVVKLNQITDKLREEKDDLLFRVEQREMKGDYDPATTKVIHMKCNPLSTAQLQRKNELEKIQKENTALHERIRILQEEGKEGQSDLTARVEVNLLNQPTSQEIDVIKEQLKNAELKNQRLMEAFSEKSQEFREVCYMLTGFRIDMISVHQYKVISMYAESADDFLHFKMGSKGEMQLLENSFSSQWGELIELYLQRQHSIPAFLSSLTMELFSQQTVNPTTT